MPRELPPLGPLHGRGCRPPHTLRSPQPIGSVWLQRRPDLKLTKYLYNYMTLMIFLFNATKASRTRKQPTKQGLNTKNGPDLRLRSGCTSGFRVADSATGIGQCVDLTEHPALVERRPKQLRRSLDASQGALRPRGEPGDPFSADRACRGAGPAERPPEKYCGVPSPRGACRTRSSARGRSAAWPRDIQRVWRAEVVFGRGDGSGAAQLAG